MGSSSPVSWSVVPERPFPAKVWLAARWPFYVPPALFARYVPRQAGWERMPRRPFPAQVWLARRQQ